MSTAIFEVTVLAAEGARLRVRCRPLANPGARSVTRSFVIRMLAADPELAGDGPSALIQAVRDAGLVPWPASPAEASRLHEPVIDRLVTSTRVIAEHPDDTYELEAEFPDPRFVQGLEVGQMFQTYASDVWLDDPKHPRASEVDRARAAAKDARTDADRESERITAWIARAESAELFAVAKGKHAKVAKRIAALTVKAKDPSDAATKIVEYLMDSDDIEEVFAEDADIRKSVADAFKA